MFSEQWTDHLNITKCVWDGLDHEKQPASKRDVSKFCNKWLDTKEADTEVMFEYVPEASGIKYTFPDTEQINNVVFDLCTVL